MTSIARIRADDAWIFDVRAVVFSGGAIKGHAFIGALETFEMAWLNHFGKGGKGFVNRIHKWAGVSIGALVALACAIGIPVKVLSEWFVKQNPLELLVHNINNIAEATSLYGLLPTCVLEETLLSLMRLRWKDRDEVELRALTFRDIRCEYSAILQVGVSNMSRNCAEMWGPDTSPDRSVLTAVAVSMSAHGLFSPVRIGDSWYSDGGLYANFPVDVFPAEEVLGIRVIENSTLGPTFTLSEYLNCIFVRSMDVREDETIRHLPEEYKRRILRLQLPALGSPTQLFFATSAATATYRSRGRIGALSFIIANVLEATEKDARRSLIRSQDDRTFPNK